jgi:hypothetical protein
MKITASYGKNGWLIRIDRYWYVYNPSLTQLAIYGLIHTMFAKHIQKSLQKAIE